MLEDITIFLRVPADVINCSILLQCVQQWICLALDIVVLWGLQQGGRPEVSKACCRRW